MKKVLAILAIASVMAACSNSGEKKEAGSTDTTKMENRMSTDTSMSKMKSDSGMNKMTADTTKK